MTSSKTDIEALSDLIEEQQIQIEKQQNQIESQAERLEELEDDCGIRESRINSITRSLDAIEEDIASLAVGAGNVTLSPIENAIVKHDDPGKSNFIKHKKDIRAARITLNFSEWSSATPGGRQINVKNGRLKALYESKYENHLASKQIERAFRAAVDLSNGKFVHRRKNGNELYLPSDKKIVTTEQEFKKEAKSTQEN
jgi:uncharacterized coiled-coil protein SlyX